MNEDKTVIARTERSSLSLDALNFHAAQRLTM